MEMQELVQEFSKKYSPEQTEVFQRAVDFAYQTHSTQLRESGEPYIVHPLEVARLVMDMGMDASSVTSGNGAAKFPAGRSNPSAGKPVSSEKSARA